MIRIDLLTSNEERSFEDFLGKCEFSLVQHSVNWCNVIRDLGIDEPLFIVAKKNNEIQGVLPLYYYKCKFGNLLTTNAWHTITGIVVKRCKSSRDL
jgi:hypothetical protein